MSSGAKAHSDPSSSSDTGRPATRDSTQTIAMGGSSYKMSPGTEGTMMLLLGLLWGGQCPSDGSWTHRENASATREAACGRVTRSKMHIFSHLPSRSLKLGKGASGIGSWQKLASLFFRGRTGKKQLESTQADEQPHLPLVPLSVCSHLSTHVHYEDHTYLPQSQCSQDALIFSLRLISCHHHNRLGSPGARLYLWDWVSSWWFGHLWTSQ